MAVVDGYLLKPPLIDNSAAPLPLSATVCGPPALSGKLIEAVFSPRLVGAKLAAVLHVPCGGSVALEQLSDVRRNWPGLVPVSETVPMVRFDPPVLVTVMVFAAAVRPTLIKL